MLRRKQTWIKFWIKHLMLVMAQMFHSSLVKWSMITSMNFSGKNFSGWPLRKISAVQNSDSTLIVTWASAYRSDSGPRVPVGVEKKSYDNSFNSEYLDMKVVWLLQHAMKQYNGQFSEGHWKLLMQQKKKCLIKHHWTIISEWLCLSTTEKWNSIITISTLVLPQ